MAKKALAKPTGNGSPIKVVIYCQEKGLARLISGELGCYLYFSDVAGEEEKEAVVRD